MTEYQWCVSHIYDHLVSPLIHYLTCKIQCILFFILVSLNFMNKFVKKSSCLVKNLYSSIIPFSLLGLYQSTVVLYCDSSSSFSYTAFYFFVLQLIRPGKNGRTSKTVVWSEFMSIRFFFFNLESTCRRVTVSDLWGGPVLFTNTTVNWSNKMTFSTSSLMPRGVIVVSGH